LQIVWYSKNLFVAYHQCFLYEILGVLDVI
jgi:hypothetical protein